MVKAPTPPYPVYVQPPKPRSFWDTLIGKRNHASVHDDHYRFPVNNKLLYRPHDDSFEILSRIEPHEVHRLPKAMREMATFLRSKARAN